MRTLDVKIRKIDRIEPHPNADKLELVVIGGYKAVVQKGVHTENDLILYIPEDSLFTDTAVADAFGVRTYLAGSNKDRVKWVKLRGVLSQGITLPLHVLFDYLHEVNGPNWDHYDVVEGQDFADVLKIVKYEEPIPIEMSGKFREWPFFLSKYDIENIKHQDWFNTFQEGEMVVGSEKLHGTFMYVAIGPGLEEGESAYVCSKERALIESDTNVYWRAVKKYELVPKLQSFLDECNFVFEDSPIDHIALCGEVVGVQDLKYTFTKGDVGFYAFDIIINGQYLDYDQYRAVCDYLGIPVVPEFYRGPYDYDTLIKLIECKSSLADHIMEGIVVQPVTNRYTEYGDRIKLKMVSEQYSTRTNKNRSELH